MHPRTPLESSKDRHDRRRSLRLRSDSRTRAAPVPPEQSAERSPPPPSPQKTKKRRPSTLQDVTNIISGKRSSASLSASDSDSVHTSKRTKNRMEHTAVTPMTTASTVTSPAVTTGLTQLKIALEPTHLPEGVVDIFNPRDNTKPCTCDENHCSSQSLSHTFLCHYGRDYAQSLQNWERAYFPPRTTTTMDGSSTASSASSFHAEASSLSQGTPPGRVNYVIGSLAAEEEHSLDPSISSQLLRHQPHLSEKMRAVLVDWLIELSEEYHLSPRSLHLAITLINRSLECGNDDESEGETLVIQRDMFQCLGW
jgi:Cyclin, N-terminal domain